MTFGTPQPAWWTQKHNEFLHEVIWKCDPMEGATFDVDYFKAGIAHLSMGEMLSFKAENWHDFDLDFIISRGKIITMDHGRVRNRVLNNRLLMICPNRFSDCEIACKKFTYLHNVYIDLRAQANGSEVLGTTRTGCCGRPNVHLWKVETWQNNIRRMEGKDSAVPILYKVSLEQGQAL